MKNSKWALLFIGSAVVATGALLWGGGVPASALSYGTGRPLPSATEQALCLSLPGLPSVLEDAERGEIPESTQVFAEKPVFSAVDHTVTLPPKPQGAKAVVEKEYPSSLSINNKTDTDLNTETLISHCPALDLAGDGPQILIFHTHTTESYNETGQDWYGDTPTRNLDNARNMVHMGEILAEVLTDLGYSVIHCQKRHDEDFNASYDKSLETVKYYLEKYPSIAVVIDLHRDSLIDAAGVKYRPVTEINGVKAAQVMFLMGVGNNTYPHPTYKENLSLAARIQAEADERFPGLMRPILVRGLRYNQYLSNGALLVELGGCGNSPEEAENGARFFGEACAAALDKIREEGK